jgi:hypothetical protein
MMVTNAFSPENRRNCREEDLIDSETPAIDKIIQRMVRLLAGSLKTN